MRPEEVLSAMREMKAGDADWRGGHTWSLVYYAGDEHIKVIQDAYDLFLMENALNPMAFPSLQRMENDVVAITANLLGGGAEASGSMTSGGTESILLAVKTYRDWARAERPEVTAPEMVLPASAHPAFLKAAQYFDVGPVLVPVGPDFRADVEAMRSAITPNTVLLVGSAPSYPHGVIDPIAELAEIARSRGLGLHVDSCLGGFILPFAARLGHEVPPFDLSIPGVTSISADVHKYGYAAKGASVILYHRESLRNHQFFVATDWSGGVYISPGMGGTRSAGAIAAAWASLHALGDSGLMDLTRRVLDITRRLMEGINAIPGLSMLGKPEASIFAFTSGDVDVFAVADAMERRGWHMDRQHMPPSLHLMVTPAHEAVVDQFLGDLRQAHQEVVDNPSLAQEGITPLYGMIATTADRGTVREAVLGLMNSIYSS
jgi:glutamate/tyrosine decarboxylase-like PLP-dependent enzyme